MWDYNIPKEDVERLLNREIEFAGHYNRKGIIIKILQGLNWFSLIKLFGIKGLYDVLGDEEIKSLRFDDMKKKYQYAKQRLHDIIQAAE